jgi:hypothetical protein
MKKLLLGLAALCSVQFLAAQNKTFDLYVVSEGNFGTPNGDVYKASRTDSLTLITSGALYQTANGTTGIDVLQDFEIFGNKAVLCGKGSHPVKLAITTYPGFDSLKTFTTIGGIQCAGKASNTKAYLSMATGSTLQQLDLNTYTLTPVSDPTSMLSSYASYMTQANGFMYVAIGSKLVKVDTATNTATATLLPGIGTIAGMQYDAFNSCIWLLGKVSGTSVLVKLEPGSNDLMNTPIVLTGITNATQLRLALNKLYFLSGKNVHIYHIASPNIPATAAYTSNLGGSSFSFAYGKSFAVDPATGDFALASATNFASPSIYEVVDGTTFQVIDTGSVGGRIANELILHTYHTPVPDTLPLPDVYAQCSATLTAPTATAGATTVTGITADPVTYNQQGNYTVTWLFVNGYDTVSQVQQVIIDDTIAPAPLVAALPPLQGDCPYTLSPPLALDNCSGNITATTDSLQFTVAGAYTIQWQYTDSAGNTTQQSQQLTVNCPTGIAQPGGSAQLFTLYPNPAYKEVSLRLEGVLLRQGYSISICNALGQLIAHHPVTGNDTRISLKGYAAGAYTIRIIKDGLPAGKVQQLIVR